MARGKTSSSSRREGAPATASSKKYDGRPPADDFLPGDTVRFSTDMMPRATLRVHLEAGLLTGNDDVLQFRTLHVPGEYPTCSNEWRTFNGSTAADTAWVCDMEGGATVAYTWMITRDGETNWYLDSLVAERFEETTLHLVW